MHFHAKAPHQRHLSPETVFSLGIHTSLMDM
jgi:hypothetical protein